ncbi:MAG: LysR substrate-binding domain-containing protein, partial [Streptosporangiaceae bacterium]
MLDLHRLRLLREFAERGTIAATALALGYTPSAVSQQLAALEREAGAALLDRSARSAELTDAGRRLAGHATAILALIEAAEADLSEREPVGRVTVAAFPTASVAFAPALTRTVRAHPGLNLLLRQTQGMEGMRQVRAGQVDVAIVDDWTIAGPPDEAGGLRAYPLVRDSLVLVVPRGHWAANPAEPVALHRLRAESWLTPPAGEPSRRAVDQVLAGAGATPAAPWEFEGLATILSLVARGIGVAILPRLTLAAGEGRVTVRELPGRSPARQVYAVARESGVRRPSVAVILTALTAAARSLSRHEARYPAGPARLPRSPRNEIVPPCRRRTLDQAGPLQNPRGARHAGYADAVKLDLRTTAAELTASLVDVESVSGNEQPLADLIHAALAGLPHLSVHRDGNAIVARTELGRP